MRKARAAAEHNASSCAAGSQGDEVGEPEFEDGPFTMPMAWHDNKSSFND